jgi:hypothetical protein
MPKTPLGGCVNKPTLLVIVLRGVLLYAASYGLYWGASFMVGSPHDFRSLWGKAALPMIVYLVVVYFNWTNKSGA